VLFGRAADMGRVNSCVELAGGLSSPTADVPRRERGRGQLVRVVERLELRALLRVHARRVAVLGCDYLRTKEVGVLRRLARAAAHGRRTGEGARDRSAGARP
jgi:hypothetical protein